MQFIAALPTFASDSAVSRLWAVLEGRLGTLDGIAYYKHPIVRGETRLVPDLALLARGFQPVVVRTLTHELDELTSLDGSSWQIGTSTIDSPVLQLDDYIVGLRHMFDRERLIRDVFHPVFVIHLPLIGSSEFAAKFGQTLADVPTIWRDYSPEPALVALPNTLTDDQWKLAKAVFQGISPLNRRVGENGVKSDTLTLGGAIRALDKEIALLDGDQHQVAIQIAPGPQRIRGLAGTGKTVVLAMKAANIHRHEPDKKILFTFHTQSLYNQTKSLISSFYRTFSHEDPDWNTLHIRHGWGSSGRRGVYTDLCKRQGARPLDLLGARSLDRQSPFRAACQDALTRTIEPEYDYILVDEAQDFPNEFFQLLYRMSKPPHRIYWAYDELQSLSALEIPRPEELFGTDPKGMPLVSLDGEYPGPMDKDFVLRKSYRCPQSILMLAHAVGLGVHSPRGCVQMLEDVKSWEAVGYRVTKGALRSGEHVEIFRPPENSPNLIERVYTGSQKPVSVHTFDSRDAELHWIANRINIDIRKENVPPDRIIVISLDSRHAKSYMIRLQRELVALNIGSTIPGLLDDAAEFAEPGLVTLATVWRAKGNEAPVVYILAFDYLYEFTEEIEARNRAFTSISRSKGWLRITGTGKRAKDVEAEIATILNDVPYLRFIFPDMRRIRKLDASETTRRRTVVRQAKESVSTLIRVDEEALAALDPSELKKLLKKIKKVHDERE